MKNKLSIAFFLLLILFNACKVIDCNNRLQDGDETGIDCGGSCPECPPIVTTGSALSISANSACCEINYEHNTGTLKDATGFQTIGICYDTLPNPTIAKFRSEKYGSFGSSGSDNILMESLIPNTKYYAKAFVTNNIATAYGNEINFTTFIDTSLLPTVITNAITSITLNSGVSGGNVISSGGSTVSEKGICWSTTTNPVISGSHSFDGTGIGSFTSNITGLTANTTYYVRAYATNSLGTGYGNQVSFTTVATIVLPTLTTSTASAIAQTTATSGGNITSDGGATVTIRGICWSTSSNPVVTGNHTTDGNGTGAFTSNIAGLTPSTTYYVRAYATNSAGTAYGNQISFSTLYACGNSISDIDGNSYNTISIGSQCWMKENLKTSKYNNGISITNVTDNTSWSSLSTGAYCIYNNSSINNTTYGKLYNYYVVNSSNNVCPVGWHLPSDADWTELTDYLGGESVAGGKLKETGTTHWNSPNTGATNETGFSALPGGYRLSDGSFYSIGDYGIWWCATEYNSNNAWYRLMYYNFSNVLRNSDLKERGFSVRCVRDL